MQVRRRRAVLIALPVLALVGWLLVRAARTEGGFATPADCVEAFGNAGKSGDAEAYLKCLDEPLRSEKRRLFRGLDELAESIRREMKEVKGWTQLPVAGDQQQTATIDVDEVRLTASCRLRFRLERRDGGWLITAIEAPKDFKPVVRFGTDVRESQEGTAPRTEP